MLRSKFSSMILLFSLMMVSWGCHQNAAFEHTHDFGKDMMWSQPLSWKWNVQKNDKPYRIKMDLQGGVHYPFENLPLEWIEIGPDGQRISHELEIIIRNPDGTFNGDKALDYLNFDVVLDDNHLFPSFGEYTYELKQKTGLESAPFMINIEIEAQEIESY